MTATRCYEHTIIARQDLSPQQAQALAETYAGVIGEQGGEVTKNEYWGLRNLAYRVKKNRKGHYGMLNLETDPDTLAEYERIMGLNEDVLRFMNIAIEKVEEGPSIMMQAAKPERGGRGERGPSGRAAESRSDAANDDKQSAEKQPAEENAGE